jgi:hypothetical protein
MAMIDINWNPDKRELRQFAGMWVVFFGAIGGYLFWNSGTEGWGPVVGGVAALVGLPGLLLPQIMKPIYVVWMAAAFPIGWTISHLLLGVIFYGLVTPIGLALRLFGYDPMHRKFEPEATTYWSERPDDTDTSRYFRMY